MEIISTTFYFIAALFILVTVHEFGHFAAAKLCGMRVDKFFVGFDFWNLKVWSTQRGETEYGIGAIPLGGYVKIAGMIDESMDNDFAATPPQPWEFRSKPVWQRLFVISAGVIMNMILAGIILIVIAFSRGEERTPISTGVTVEKGSVFAEMGFQSGDVITAVNGKPVKYWEDVRNPDNYMNAALTYTVRRGNEALTLTAPENILSRIGKAEGTGIQPMYPPLIGEVTGGFPAEQAGLAAGDRILKIAGIEIAAWENVPEVLSLHKSEQIAMEWKTAKGELKQGPVTPNAQGKIGIAPARITEFTPLGFFPAIGAGIEQTGKLTSLIVKSFGKLFSGKDDIRDNIGGPVAIAKMAGQSARVGGAFGFFLFVAMLSINLALVNMLPVPGLDGGHFVMNSVEGIIGREVPLKVKMAIQQVGVTALLLLSAFVLYNDIFRR
ncbi:MAG: RIP metalloprotease RseP [Rhizobacter sp.]|nr:RIP metalloprotease RseP [Chlorobiales bacterium]